jgi:multiple antibiotic resistance protein
VRWSVASQTFVILLVIMDPVAALPVFIGLTRGFTADARRRAAIRATIAAGGLVLGFAVGGDLLLSYLDVSLDALAIAGGLLLLLLALEMLRGIDEPADGGGDIALVPLASPLVAGPGAIATTIILARQNPGVGGRVSVVLGAVGAVVVVGLVLLVGNAVARRMPAAIGVFLTRVFGLILAAIGVQLILDGIQRATG